MVDTYNINSNIKLYDFLTSDKYNLKFIDGNLSLNDSNILKKMISKLFKIKQTRVSAELQQYFMRDVLSSNIYNIENVKECIVLYELISMFYCAFNNDKKRNIIDDIYSIDDKNFSIKKKGITLDLFKYFYGDASIVKGSIISILGSYSSTRYALDHHKLYNYFIYFLLLSKSCGISIYKGDDCIDNCRHTTADTLFAIDKLNYCLKIKPKKNDNYFKPLYTYNYIINKYKNLKDYHDDNINNKDKKINEIEKNIEDNEQTIYLIENDNYIPKDESDAACYEMTMEKLKKECNDNIESYKNDIKNVYDNYTSSLKYIEPKEHERFLDAVELWDIDYYFNPYM